jgi:hypothetical protein
MHFSMVLGTPHGLSHLSVIIINNGHLMSIVAINSAHPLFDVTAHLLLIAIDGSLLSSLAMTATATMGGNRPMVRVEAYLCLPLS